ncbi:hypothetical protein VP01_7349g1, partial [Puccinia sorghi]
FSFNNVIPPTSAGFITSFNGSFLDPECKGKSQKALPTFKKSFNMQSYTHQFNFHAYNSAWSNNILALAMQLGNKLEANRSSTFKISPPTHSTTMTDPNVMDLSEMNGRLSYSEHKKMMQAGQCFQCRQV